jgi:hypothetical protein
MLCYTKSCTTFNSLEAATFNHVTKIKIADKNGGLGSYLNMAPIKDGGLGLSL